MNQSDQNINKDMIDSDLIDVDSVDFSDDQTWLYVSETDSGQAVDVVDWHLSCDWPGSDSDDYLKAETELYNILDNILKNELSTPDKQKFDSRTFVRPKKRFTRPSLQNVVESPITQPPNPMFGQHMSPSNKYMTYNKYSNPLGGVSPMLRLKTFNVDTNTDNSTAVKEYAMKRRSLVQEDESQLEDVDKTLVSEASTRLSTEPVPSTPIHIDYSQPAHNINSTFNKGMVNIINERGSLNMYQSGESLMRMSPPSLVSSINMENSGNFNMESLEGRKSLLTKRDAMPQNGRESIDPMMTSMTLSILDEKDMSTSFLSQTTYPDHDSLMDSLPPSLVSSVNSSYIVPNMGRSRNDSQESNVFSSATFTHLEQSERLLAARPRAQMFNSFTKRDSGIKNTESYTKSREEASQIDLAKVANDTQENTDVRNPMAETITLHFSNNKFKDDDAEKENLNATFEKSDAFYKDMAEHDKQQKTLDIGRNSLNVTLDKQELNEIIQARQKLSLARRALPTEEKTVPLETSPTKIIQLPNQTIVVPKQSMDNASELLSRRRIMNNSNEEIPTRETPKRNATFKKVSPPKLNNMDTTMVYTKPDESKIIDINSATLNLIDSSDKTLQQEEWNLQERAMVGSSESTDTGTFSSSSPPESVPETMANDPRLQIASTPLTVIRKGTKNDLLDLQNTISPIYDILEQQQSKLQHGNAMEKTYDAQNTTINSATIVRKTAKRDILSVKSSPEKRTLQPCVRSPPQNVSPTNAGPTYTGMAPPVSMPRKTGLPTSKLRQYSSHKELSRIPGTSAIPSRGGNVCPPPRTMQRRAVYASNPVLSPTSTAPSIQEEKPQAEPAKPVPVLVRQGTETLRRERPHSQLIAPKDLRLSSAMPPPLAVPVSHRTNSKLAPATRPYSISSASQLRVARPSSGPPHKPAPAVQQTEQQRPYSGNEARSSALPRPSRLPAPARRGLRPPSVYSAMPTADLDHY